MSDIFENKGALAATIVVAASDSLNKGAANYVCSGANDNVEIQAALDALPATGGEVFLLDGTYNIEASLVLDSYQTLRGCGRNTILTTTTDDVDIIIATGGDGSEKVGILIADFCVDGDAGGAIGNHGIYWTYVGYSKIHNIWAYDCVGTGEEGNGIYLNHCDFNQVINNVCHQSGYDGIRLEASLNNIISDNICQGNYDGIYLRLTSKNNTITRNICQGNQNYGIYLVSSHNNLINNNTCQGNNDHGIRLVTSNDNTISVNTCLENSQVTDNTYANIMVENSNYNLIASNICRQGEEANKPKYGITISSGTKNQVEGNDLHDAGKTANFADAGTCTIVQDDNREIEITQVKHYVYAVNQSAGALAAGDVVVLKANADGNQITTTTTEGDQAVLGMVAEAIGGAACGYVLVKGKTTALKVDGAIDIAIGDLIGTFTTAKIGMKAASGKMAFAIALEAYATNDSNGVIDALLISPRQAI